MAVAGIWRCPPKWFDGRPLGSVLEVSLEKGRRKLVHNLLLSPTTFVLYCDCVNVSDCLYL